MLDALRRYTAICLIGLLWGCAGQQATTAMPRDARLEAAAEVAAELWNAAIEQDQATLEALGAGDLADLFADNQPVEIIELGQPFTKNGYVGVYVPYKVRFDDGTHIFVHRHNLALRDDNEAEFLYDGGI